MKGLRIAFLLFLFSGFILLFWRGEGISIPPATPPSSAPPKKTLVPLKPQSPPQAAKGLRSAGQTKIKLKRDTKGGYSWEIWGGEVEQILKIDQKLRERLSPLEKGID